MDTRSSRRLSPCADQARRFDRDRFLCALFAPADRREALYALYAFNHEIAKVRETVSEPLLGRMRLQWWRESLAAAAAGHPPDHPVASALAGAIGRHGLDSGQFERLISARAGELDDWAPTDLDELCTHAEETSAPLALLALRVLDAETAAARVAARHVGIAWALTGILRMAVRHDRFPADIMAAEGVAARARAHLAEARAVAADVPPAARPVLLPATLADGYLARLRRAGNDPRHPSFAQARPAGRTRLLWRVARGGY
ncbi:MAG: phytoene/squalene synthase family protein [Alphaproteobacteria bacterium]